MVRSYGQNMEQCVVNGPPRTAIIDGPFLQPTLFQDSSCQPMTVCLSPNTTSLAVPQNRVLQVRYFRIRSAGLGSAAGLQLQRVGRCACASCLGRY